MNDPVRLGALHERFQRRAVDDVDTLEAKDRIVEQKTQAVFLEAHIVVAIEDVQTDDLVASREQSAGNVSTDESGYAGDKNLHLRGRQW